MEGSSSHSKRDLLYSEQTIDRIEKWNESVENENLPPKMKQTEKIIVDYGSPDISSTNEDENNKIINLLEEDFLNNIENEFSDYKSKKKCNTKNQRKTTKNSSKKRKIVEEQSVSEACLPEKGKNDKINVNEKIPIVLLERLEDCVNSQQNKFEQRTNKTKSIAINKKYPIVLLERLKNFEQNQFKQGTSANDVSFNMNNELDFDEKINESNSLNMEIDGDVSTQKLLQKNSNNINQNNNEISNNDDNNCKQNQGGIKNIDRSENVVNLQKMKNELSNITIKKSVMLATLKTCLNLTSNIVSHCSYSENLFTDFCSAQHKNPINMESQKLNNNFGALSLSNSSLSNNVISYLKNVKDYCNKINVLSQTLIDESQQFRNIFKDNVRENNEFRSLFSRNDVTVQTDNLVCPKCDYTFHLNANDNDSFKNTFFDSDIMVHKKVPRQLQLSPETISCNSSSNLSTRNFKRIRSIESDSDSDSSATKKSRILNFRSKLFYRNDLNIVFESENLTQNNQAGTNKESLDTREILEREYKQTKCMPQANIQLESDKHNDLLDNIDISILDIKMNSLDNKKSQFFESHPKNNKSINNNIEQIIQKRTSASSKNDILSESLFGDGEKDGEHSDTDNYIKLTGNQVNNNKVANFTKDIVNSLNCDKDIFDSDNIVENTPQQFDIETTDNAKIGGKGIPPPPAFQDTEQNPDTATITSMTPDILPLNEMDMNRVDFEELVANVSKTQSNEPKQKLGSSENKDRSLRQRSSPLQILVKPNPPSKPIKNLPEKNILNYAPSSRQINDNSSYVPKYFSNMNLLQSTTAVATQSKISHSSSNISLHNINSTMKSPICIAWTRLQSNEVGIVRSFVNKFQVKYRKVFDDNVTHMIVSVDDKNRVNDQTCKYVLAIAKGIWVVSIAWLKDSITYNQLLPEESYEALDVTGISGPKSSRLYRKIKPLFQNFVFYIFGPFNLLKKEDCENAIVSLGGEIRSSALELLEEKDKICLILSEYRETQNNQSYHVFREKLKVLVIELEWLSLTIGQYQLDSVRPYLLCRDDGVEKLGYPLELIARVPDTCTQNAAT